MLNINGFEFVLIAIAAMLLLGPKQLASTARKLGRVYAKFAGYAEDFKSAINSATEPINEIQREFKSDRRSFIDQIKPDRVIENSTVLTSIDDYQTEIGFEDFLNPDYKTQNPDINNTDDFLGESK